MSSKKGSAFERELCKQISLWWTKDLEEPRSDCFWRTAGSGGRATVRSKKNQKTAGHYGDICATDTVGIPFLKLVTLEVKRGYSRHTIADLLDKPDGAAKQMYEKWFEQAEKSAKDAGSYSWMIIVKRDRRETLVIYPISLEFSLNKVETIYDSIFEYVSTVTTPDGLDMRVCHLSSFLHRVLPKNILNLLESLK